MLKCLEAFHKKKWVGVGLFGVCLCPGLVILLWITCKLAIKNKKDKIMITQALTALEHGVSAEVWLSVLRQ